MPVKLNKQAAFTMNWVMLQQGHCGNQGRYGQWTDHHWTAQKNQCHFTFQGGSLSVNFTVW